MVLSAFDLSQTGSTNAASQRSAAAKQRNSRYQYGISTSSSGAGSRVNEEDEVHFYSFCALSDNAPRRDCLMTDKGATNVSCVFQLEHDDPLQQQEDRSAYCRSELVTRQKLHSSSSRQTQRDEQERSGTGKAKRLRYHGCDAQAYAVAQRDAEWIAGFVPSARPYEVTPSGGRCAQKQHYCTTFEMVQAAPESAMYISESERFSP